MRWGDIPAGFRPCGLGKTTLSGPVCSTGSMDSDSRMGQGLGQNPEKPEGQISLGEWIEGG